MKKSISWQCDCGDEIRSEKMGVIKVCNTCGKHYKVSREGEVFMNTSTNSPEAILGIIAQVTLWIGIIASLIWLIVALAEEMYILLLVSPIIFLLCLVTWASLRVKVNISNSLKEIVQKMKQST